MPLSLAQLTAPLTTQAMRQRLLNELQGLGLVDATQTGTGSVALSGNPVSAYSCQVKIVTQGEPGAAQFQYSLDGGLTFSASISVPSSGATALGVSGVSVTFSAGPAGAGTSFLVGDLFAFSLSTPTFPVTSWQDGGTARSIVEIDAAELADLTGLIAQIALGGYVTGSPGVTGAAGSWLDIRAGARYNLTRNAAIATIGQVTLSDTASAGPFNVSAGQLWVGATASLSTSSPLRFLNTTGGTLPKGGALTISVAAEVPGSAYNVANGAITTMLVSLPGVTVANSPGSGSWITQAGADVESDLALATRCQGKWSSIGIGATAATYDYWARTSTSVITRTKVTPSGSTGGEVDIVVGSTLGPVSSPDVATAQAYINARIPTATTAVVTSATQSVLNPAITMYGKAQYQASAVAQASANLTALVLATPIGGTLYRAAVIEALMAPQGVDNVVVTTPSGDTVLSASSVLVVSIGSGTITWVNT